MQCDYFDAGTCRSCALMGVPYAVQLADKAESVRTALARHVDDSRWLAPFSGPESGFRNKAKLVVGGRRGAPVLGILDRDGATVDLTGCGLYEPGLGAAVLALPPLVARSGLTPYDVQRRTGELKNILVTHSPAGELMVRFVLRSPGQLPRLRESLPDLQAVLPGATVVTANLLPEHKAVLEGVEEVVLSGADSLAMPVNEVTLYLRPQSFFQTNTVVAAGLYAQVTRWVAQVQPTVLWDLYCGVGGFALHALQAGAAPAVRGLELSRAAVESANRSAREMGAEPGAALFEVGDAAADSSSRLAGLASPAQDSSARDSSGRDSSGRDSSGRDSSGRDSSGRDVLAGRDSSGRDVLAGRSPDVLVVNPPRRGIGPVLAGRIEHSPGLRHVVYSSCNVTSLVRDLAAMPSLRVRAARLFDMFPQTTHHEVAVLLERV